MFLVDVMESLVKHRFSMNVMLIKVKNMYLVPIFFYLFFSCLIELSEAKIRLDLELNYYAEPQLNCCLFLVLENLDGFLIFFEKTKPKKNYSLGLGFSFVFSFKEHSSFANNCIAKRKKN